jgi:flagellar basal-body rod modification protein FlgD
MTTATTATSTNPFAALTQGNSSAASSTASSAAGGSAVSTATGATSVTTAYNTFITLLTTQLQHQDPLNPTNTDTFTQELIQLSGVEQQLQTNSTLSSMSTDLTAISQANGLGYVGKTITASGATAPLQNGEAQWSYSLNSPASSVTLSVQDASGNTVYSASGNPASGQHSFSWNGATNSGTTDSSGDFTLSVTAADASGNAVTTTTSMVGQVTGVDSSSGTTQLLLGDITVPVTNVTQIN